MDQNAVAGIGSAASRGAQGQPVRRGGRPAIEAIVAEQKTRDAYRAELATLIDKYKSVR